MAWETEESWALKTAAIYAAQTAARLGLPPEAKADLAQDLALAAWRASARVQAGRNPRPYLEQAIRNGCRMAVRAHYAGKAVFDRACVRVGDWLI